MRNRAAQTLAALNLDVIVSQFLDEHSRTEQTKRTYRADLQAYLDWARANKVDPLRAWTQDTNRYVEYALANADWVFSTKRQRTRTVRQFYAYISRRFEVPSPMEQEDSLPLLTGRSQSDPVAAMDFQEFVDFMRGALDHPYKPYALVVGLLGINALTPTEVTAADVTDVEVTPGQASIRLAKRKPPTRSPIVPGMRLLLDEVVGGRSQGPLIRGPHGGRNAVLVRQAVVAVARAMNSTAGVTPIRLRTTAGTLAARDGASTHALREYLGVSETQVSRYQVYSGNLAEEHASMRVWRRIQADGPRNDLLDQADRLVADGADPTAIIVVVGAALEQDLADLCRRHSVGFGGRPSIDTYRGALVREGVISKTDAARIEKWRDLRNDAAHGRRAVHSEAVVMVDEVRRFLNASHTASRDS